MARRRVVYRVHYVGRIGMWGVTRIGPDGFKDRIQNTPTKALAVALAVEEARGRWRIAGQLTQVVVMNKDGRIGREMTYGKDPKRHRG